MSRIRTREAKEGDVEAIREIFRATYGDDYPYQDFYDTHWLKRAVFGDHILMVVAEDEADGTVVGTGSVNLDIGAHSDLVGELGRLAVHPDARGKGVGKAIMARRLELINDRLHVAVADNRTAHPYSQRISWKFDFVPVGFLPLKYRFNERESVAYFARLFGPAQSLRRNHPRVAPGIASVAELAMSGLGLEVDLIVDESSPPYPTDGDFELAWLESERMPDLLRIERGRVRSRGVFGPMKLNYGFFMLAAHHAEYLIARRPGGPKEAVVGGLGFLHDETDRNIRIIELIAAADQAIPFLLTGLLDRARELDVEYIDVDVNAHDPRLQRTLLGLGFLPAAYVPALAFHDVERLDSVKMIRLLVPPEVGEPALIDSARPVFDAVMEGFRARSVLPRIASHMEELAIFEGLSAEQARRLAGALVVRDYPPGSELFVRGENSEELFVLLEGEVDVLLSSGAQVGTVGEGGTVGENAMLSQSTHSASARTRQGVVTAVLTRDRLDELTVRRPDIVVVLYRNLAVELGEKLKKADSVLDLDRSS